VNPITNNLLISFLFLFSPSVHASFSFGPALTGATSGRIVPSLYVAQTLGNYTVSYFGTGVATPVYYQSTYQLGVLKVWQTKPFIWGELQPAVGLAALYSKRGYSAPNSELDQKEDWTVGPDFKVTWYFAGPVFMSTEVLIGLRNPWNFLFLAPQDEANIALGVSL
jgi:hypothetical protein